MRYVRKAPSPHGSSDVRRVRKKTQSGATGADKEKTRRRHMHAVFRPRIAGKDAMREAYEGGKATHQEDRHVEDSRW